MSAVVPQAPDRSGWCRCWEDNVYGQGRHLNRYPYHSVVGFVLTHFGPAADRSTVRILELGFGAGNNLWFAAREGFSVAGIEGSPTAVAYAKRRFADEGLAGDMRVGDFAALPWPNESFDMVLDRQALAHTTKATIVRALEESHRVLKPRGRLLSIIYSDEHPGRACGTDRGHNDYDDFSDGYFAGLGTTHFATHREIDELFGARFTVGSAVHTREEQTLHGEPHVSNAFWKVECVKET